MMTTHWASTLPGSCQNSGMSGLALSVVPFALGAAVSPTLLTVELMILSGKARPKARAWFFVIGAVTVLLVFSVLCASVLRNATDAGGGPPSPWEATIKAAIAVILLALGLRQLRPRKTVGEQHKSRVAVRLHTARLPFFLGVGAVAMLTNFSTLVLYVPAMHLITRSSDDVATKVAAFAVLVLLTVLPFVLPVLAVTVAGRRSDAMLARLNGFVSRNSRRISALICFSFGAFLIYSAVKQWVS